MEQRLAEIASNVAVLISFLDQASQPCRESLLGTLSLGIALPNDQHPVAPRTESADRCGIASLVRLELGHPKLTIPLGEGGPHASPVLVPKTPVNEDGPPRCPIRHVGRPGQVTIPNTETQPEGVEDLSHDQLG